MPKCEDAMAKEWQTSGGRASLAMSPEERGLEARFEGCDEQF